MFGILAYLAGHPVHIGHVEAARMWPTMRCGGASRCCRIQTRSDVEKIIAECWNVFLELGIPEEKLEAPWGHEGPIARSTIASASTPAGIAVGPTSRKDHDSKGRPNHRADSSSDKSNDSMRRDENIHEKGSCNTRPRRSFVNKNPKWDKNGNKVGTRTAKWDKNGNKVGTRTPKWDKNGNKVGTRTPK